MFQGMQLKWDVRVCLRNPVLQSLSQDALRNFIFLEIVGLGHPRACRDGLPDPTELLPSWLQESRKCVNNFMCQLFPALVLSSMGQVEEER